MGTSHNWRAPATRFAGELTVIILGVLVALWADGWVQQRAEHRVESSRIVALGDNVAATRERLTTALSEAEFASSSLREIASWEAVPELDARTEPVLLRALLFGPSFTPEINVYVDLKSSGDLGLLRSTELRQALARMDAVLEQLQFLQNDLIRVQQLNYDPFVIANLSLDRGFADYLGLADVARGPVAMPTDIRVLRNLTLFKLDLVSQLVRQLNDTGRALDAVDQALVVTR